MYIKLTNNVPDVYTIQQLKQDNPNTSFPSDITSETLASYNVYKVKETSPPTIDSKTHKNIYTVELIDNEWTQVWQTLELPIEQASNNVRAYRDTLLAMTDWTQQRDISLSLGSKYIGYRQQLRDISLQENFPYAVVWPVDPGSTPTNIPTVISMRQARLALLGAGLLDAVEPAIASIPNAIQQRAAKITWEYSTEVHRTNLLISALSANLGLTESDLDHLFLEASKL